jgi:hypothetical protein
MSCLLITGRIALDIKLTKPQSQIFAHPARHKVVVAGRRFGKTLLALVWLWKHASEKPNAMCFYIAPTYQMAKQISWRQLKQMFGQYAAKINEAELYLELYNGSAIYLKGSENADGLRGISASAVVMDEAAYQNEDVWNYVVAPACSDKEAPVLFISTPSGWGWFKNMYDHGIERMDDHWAAWQYTTAEGGNVSEKELAERKRTLPKKVFEQEYLASWSVLSNRVYSNFEFDKNLLTGETDISEYADIHVGIDFNVAQMSAVIAVKVADEIHVIDELILAESNTQELADVLKVKYQGKHIYCYPDPSGRSRKSSAALGQTDFTILEDAGFYVSAPKRHDAVQDRINTVQSLLCNANGERRLYVHKRCKSLLDSLQGLTYDVDKNAPDKKSGLDHCSDSLGYLCLRIAPINQRVTTFKLSGLL